MKTRSLLGFTFAQCIVFAASIATSHADSDKSVTAAQVNGTWKTKGGEFKIWALDVATLPDVTSSTARDAVLTALNAHDVGTATLTVTSTAP